VEYSAELLSASEMTYIVSSGALNSTHSLTLCPLVKLMPIVILRPGKVVYDSVYRLHRRIGR